MKLHNDASRYNQQVIDLLEDPELQQQILDDLEKGYSRRATAARNGTVCVNKTETVPPLKLVYMIG